MNEEDYVAPQQEPEIVSTSQAINLTSAIASISALWALFFCFADQRSRAVRRFSVQSVGLGAVHLLLGMIVWTSARCGLDPRAGHGGALAAAAGARALYGAGIRAARANDVPRLPRQAHVLPVIGQALRRFE